MTGNGPSASIVRGKHVITRALDRHRWEEVDDGAVLQRGGIIAAVGAFADIRAANPDAPVVGDGAQVLLPGFVNRATKIRTKSRKPLQKAQSGLI